MGEETSRLEGDVGLIRTNESCDRVVVFCRTIDLCRGEEGFRLTWNRGD